MQVNTDTRQRIIDAAVDIFNEDPSAPLERVAERVPVTRRTLHRYFNDRADLLMACRQDIRERCSKAMNRVFEQPLDPLIRLKSLLYAAIDCGTKYAFFHKFHGSEHAHSHSGDDCAAYDAMQGRFHQFIVQLQEDGLITDRVTAAWLCEFFTGVVTTAVRAVATGAIAVQSQKPFAWISLNNGIKK